MIPGDLRRRFVEAQRRFHPFVSEPGRWRRLEAEAADLARRFPEPAARPALFGVSFGVKDIFHVDGLSTRGGSRLPAGALAGAEAESVRRLRAAGALVLGKTVTTELAYVEPGPTRNPRAPGHTPGGSSSGSAAAVAAGVCPFALGTQTIGSIGRPAAFCGIVGFKPTYDRVPRDGVIPLAPSLDHVGVLAADVPWARAAAAVLCDGWRGEPDPRAARRPALAVPVGPYLEAAEPVARHHLRALQRRLAAAGFVVREVPILLDFEDLDRRHRRLLAAEAAAVHAERYARHPDLFRPRTAELIERGRQVGAAEVEAARAGRAALRRELEAALAERDLDLWLAPAATGPPPLGLASTGNAAMNLPWTHAGMPAVVLPAGTAPAGAESLRAAPSGSASPGSVPPGTATAGLPLGIQLVARAGDDEVLLAWAERLVAVVGCAASNVGSAASNAGSAGPDVGSAAPNVGSAAPNPGSTAPAASPRREER